MNALITTVLDLDEALGGNADLLLAGGLGLYLRQEDLRQKGTKTLLPLTKLPPARTTQDIDLFVRAEVIANRALVIEYRAALDELGFVVVPGAEFLKFSRSLDGINVLIDLMAGPLGEHESNAVVRDSRVRPRGLSGKHGFHARTNQDALGVEHEPFRLTVTSEPDSKNNTARSCEVLIPRPFPYAFMKLCALRDRLHDEDHDQGRHHAMDLYRIAGLLTEEDEGICMAIAQEYKSDPKIVECRGIIEELFVPSDGLGRIRLLEYQRANPRTTPEVDPDWLVDELKRLLQTD